MFDSIYELYGAKIKLFIFPSSMLSLLVFNIQSEIYLLLLFLFILILLLLFIKILLIESLFFPLVLSPYEIGTEYLFNWPYLFRGEKYYLNEKIINIFFDF